MKRKALFVAALMGLGSIANAQTTQVTNEGLKMIHASTSRGVMVSNVNKDPYWFPKLQYAVKVIKE